MNNFDKLSNDVIIYMAVTMELPEILSLCSSSKRFNNIICLNDTFWLNRLFKKYNIVKSSIPNWRSPKSYYEYLTEQIRYYIPNDLLVFSAMVGDLNLVKIALQKGADVNYNNDKALKEASTAGYFNVVKYLISVGADIHAQHDIALSMASRKGRLDIVKHLVSVGADVNAWGNSALNTAVRHGELDIVKYLMSVGAKINPKTIDIAQDNDHPDIVEYLKTLN